MLFMSAAGCRPQADTFELYPGYFGGKRQKTFKSEGSEVNG